MDQIKIVDKYCDFMSDEIRNKDISEINEFIENYDDENEVFDLVDSVKFVVITQEEHTKLLEFKWMYEGLQE